MSEIIKIQDPAETLDYSLDWTSWLASGDTIATSTWAVSPTGPTVSNPSVSGNVTTVFLAGVALAGIYYLVNTITTAAGRTSDRSITVRGFPQ